MSEFKLENKTISPDSPVYFIADIAANHDGDIERAKDLIFLAAESGADAAKFQHFTADSIVSEKGFNDLGNQMSHQSNWSKSVFEVYKDATLNNDWNPLLKEACKEAGITFLTSPYSFELVDKVDEFVEAYKIGSGDITWLDLIEYIASKDKPVFIASGASNMQEVIIAIERLQRKTKDIVLMQCNTNYTASLKNFKYINLNVLNSYRDNFPDITLGLSDHTPGHSTVLGAVSLGARVIEKHFTDNIDRIGPDHKFSMSPKTWKDMVMRTRELEYALGSSIKIVEQNELETVVLQRRSIRLKRNIPAGKKITMDDIEFLRPCPKEGIPPCDVSKVIGKIIKKNMFSGDLLTWKDVR